MGVTITNIQNYIEQNVDETKLGIYNKPIALNYVTKAVGTKGSKKINQLKVNAVFGQGESCGSYGESTGAFTQLDVVSEVIATQITFCESTLRDTYLSSTLTAGQLDQTSTQMEAWLQSQLVEATGEEVGLLFWNGDKTLTGNKAQMDGFVKTLGASGVSVSSPIDWTVANAFSETLRIALAYTGKDDLYIFMGKHKFNLLVASIGSEFKSSAYAPQIIDGSFTEARRMELKLPLTAGVTVVCDPALDTLRGSEIQDAPVYAFAKENIVATEDLATDLTDVKVFTDAKDELLYVRMKFLLGLGIWDKSQVVKYVPTVTP